MPLPAWGVAVIALYALLQIPAVLFLARYCEVEAEELPTPPTRAYWRGEESGDDRGDRGPIRTADESTPPVDPARAADESTLSVEQAGSDRVRCRHCGATNDPSFGRCRRCVAQL